MIKSQPTLREKVSIGVSLLLRRLNALLPGCIIFFSATQLTKHFWPSYALVGGVRVDYLSPSFGFFDLLLLLLILTTPFKCIHKIISRNSPILLILILSLLVSPFPNISLAYFLRFSLYFLSAGILISLHRTKLIKPLIASLLFQFGLGLFQVLSSQSGVFYWLGERRFSMATLGVARASFFNHFTLRAYGTFSHPNVLAGWSLIALFLIFKQTSLLLKFISFILVWLIVFLTQSRLALFVLILFGFNVLLKTKSLHLRFSLWSLLLSLLAYIHPLSRSLAISTRLKLFRASWQIFKQFPLFGVGLNASLRFYPLLSPRPPLLQPDHNSFSLLISWVGMFGLISFCLILLKSHILKHRLDLLLLSSLILFDHYFFTSPQGLFIISLFLYELNSNQA